MERKLPGGSALNELEVVASESPREFAIRATAGPTPFRAQARSRDLRPRFFAEEQQTFFAKGSGPFQLDHVFGDVETEARVRDWRVDTGPVTRTPTRVELEWREAAIAGKESRSGAPNPERTQTAIEPVTPRTRIGRDGGATVFPFAPLRQTRLPSFSLSPDEPNGSEQEAHAQARTRQGA